MYIMFVKMTTRIFFKNVLYYMHIKNIIEVQYLQNLLSNKNKS